ncbi:hypothetical protein M405DRAFT_880558 [Rhizopogon salebrosus TDB-379]|nr:hypothetical protein M405DRAFT_880558 [Rhizopogon salebrosus TDB-379]
MSELLDQGARGIASVQNNLGKDHCRRTYVTWLMRQIENNEPFSRTEQWNMHNRQGLVTSDVLVGKSLLLEQKSREPHEISIKRTHFYQEFPGDLARYDSEEGHADPNSGRPRSELLSTSRCQRERNRLSLFTYRVSMSPEMRPFSSVLTRTMVVTMSGLTKAIWQLLKR